MPYGTYYKKIYTLDRLTNTFMQVQKGKIMEDVDRDLYWGIIYFLNEDKKTRVFICSSVEFLRQEFKKDEFNEDDFDTWQNNAVRKWESLGNDLFNQDIHYDVYAISPEGEEKGLNFLLEKSKS